MKKFFIRVWYVFYQIFFLFLYFLHFIDKDFYLLKKIYFKGKYFSRLSFKKNTSFKDDGVSVAFDFGGDNSLSETGRYLLETLVNTKIPVDVFDTFKRQGKNYYGMYKKFVKDNNLYRKKIICNMGVFYKEPEFENYITLFWEFESGLLYKRKYIFDGLSGVITFSKFCYDYVKKIAPVGMKIYNIRYPFIKNWSIKKSSVSVRKFYQIPQKCYVVFFNFDYASCYERKNPEGVLMAFSLAFQNEKNVRLVIKTNHSNVYPDKVKRLMNVVEVLGISDRIIFVDNFVSKNEMMELINSCDCYISLHRGEGLGLGMLEAMYLGKPVIATNYSGNTEFMNKENSLLVDYRMVDADVKDFPVYAKVEKWAEPDINQASMYLKKLYQDKTFAKKIGGAAQKFVSKYYDGSQFRKDVQNFLKQ